uniref:NADH dehydrogenase [ubiquinone] 1 beta subcomplex subunit 2, mitochondrial n=1 Tax=Geotrypetes seraphini TaxID=260995 RepID=A0A6P8SAT0_GEOSA|nr:NADH dehydrogenase [ubiquinone] 1 beta subcomplex subunit 2, mitochondrial isoform X2 [Geotrypetes seraphini]
MIRPIRGRNARLRILCSRGRLAIRRSKCAMASTICIGSGIRAGIRFLRGGGVKGAVQVRNGSGGVHITPRYRQFPELTKSQGHFPYPDVSKWTDEELGIPPDDEE